MKSVGEHTNAKQRELSTTLQSSDVILDPTSPLLSSTMATIVHIWYSLGLVWWLEICLCSRNPKVKKKKMQLSTFLSLLLSVTCLLICLLLITVLPSVSFSFTSLPALVEHHSQVCCNSSVVVVAALGEIGLRLKIVISEGWKYETSGWRGTFFQTSITPPKLCND